MAGFGGGDVKARFIPDQSDATERPRFWESSGGSGSRDQEQDQERDEAAPPNLPDPARWPEPRLDAMPAGTRPGEARGGNRPGSPSGAGSRLMAQSDAAGAYLRRQNPPARPAVTDEPGPQPPD